MSTYSLFRYPGGKGRMFRQLARFVPANAPLFCEPFAGGAGVGWRRLGEGSVQRLWLNDLDPGISAIWEAVRDTPDALSDALRLVVVDPGRFYELKEQLSDGRLSGVDLAVAKLVIHQISYSGLGEKAGSPIGGRAGIGQWRVDCRWNPDALAAKIHRMHGLSDRRLLVTNWTWEKVLVSPDWYYYVDPPYVGIRPALYRYGAMDHEALRDRLACLERWSLSYDDHPLVRELYAGCHIEELSMTASVGGRGRKTELLITPRPPSRSPGSPEDPPCPPR